MASAPRCTAPIWRSSTDAQFRELERVFYDHQVLTCGSTPDTGAVRSVRAPHRAAAAARDRPVPPSGRPEHPDPVERQGERRAHRAAGRRLVLPHRLLLPAGAGARHHAVLARGARRSAATRCSPTRSPPTTTCRCDENAHRSRCARSTTTATATTWTRPAARPPRRSPTSRRPRCR